MRLSTSDRYLFSATIPKPNSALFLASERLVNSRSSRLDLVENWSQKNRKKKKRNKRKKKRNRSSNQTYTLTSNHVPRKTPTVPYYTYPVGGSMMAVASKRRLPLENVRSYRSSRVTMKIAIPDSSIHGPRSAIELAPPALPFGKEG